jgi:hypothetical protein
VRERVDPLEDHLVRVFPAPLARLGEDRHRPAGQREIELPADDLRHRAAVRASRGGERRLAGAVGDRPVPQPRPLEDLGHRPVGFTKRPGLEARHGRGEALGEQRHESRPERGVAAGNALVLHADRVPPRNRPVLELEPEPDPGRGDPYRVEPRGQRIAGDPLAVRAGAGAHGGLVAS